MSWQPTHLAQRFPQHPTFEPPFALLSSESCTSAPGVHSPMTRSSSAITRPVPDLHRGGGTTDRFYCPFLLGYFDAIGLANACHHVAGSTRIAASPSRRPDAVRSAATAVWMKGSVLL